MGLPYSSSHAGQILFGPEDGYLYLMISDGSPRDDPYNFAQNKKSLLGKILRTDVDHKPSVTEINELGLWGNYSIPKENPFIADNELEPEIWALSFKDPWRCGDSERPSYFLCGDCGQDHYEEVNCQKGWELWVWRVYEGPLFFHPAESPGGNTSISSINPIFPEMGYYHSERGTNIESPSIIGGSFWRSRTDPCMYGRYLYMDLYGVALWAGTEIPENIGKFNTTRIQFKCAHDSPN